MPQGPIGSQIPGTTTQAPTQQTPKVPDVTFVRDVQQQLADYSAFTGVRVAAHNGRVELTGSVPSKEDRKKAKEMAKNVPGVASVKEHLNVGPAELSGNSGTMGSPGPASANPGKSMPPDTQAPESAPKTVPDTSANPPRFMTTPAKTGDARRVMAAYQAQATIPAQANSPHQGSGK